MPLIDQWQGYTGLPDYSDVPNIPTHLQGMFNFLGERAIPRYASPAARDAELPSPSDGQMAWVGSPAALQVRHDGGWQTVWAPFVAARRSGGAEATIPSSSITDFSCGPFEYSSGGMSAGSLAGSIIVPASGIYAVGASVRWNSGFTGVTQIRINRNGTTILVDSQSVSQGGSGAQHTNSVAGDVQLSAGDELSTSVFQNSGSDRSTTTFAGPFLTARLAGRL